MLNCPNQFLEKCEFALNTCLSLPKSAKFYPNALKKFSQIYKILLKPSKVLPNNYIGLPSSEQKMPKLYSLTNGFLFAKNSNNLQKKKKRSSPKRRNFSANSVGLRSKSAEQRTFSRDQFYAQVRSRSRCPIFYVTFPNPKKLLKLSPFCSKKVTKNFSN